MLNKKKINYTALFKLVGLILLIYFLYVLIFGGIIFAIKKPILSNYKDLNPIDRFYKEEIGEDSVVLLEDGKKALLARVNVIENANERIDIAYHTIQNGLASDIIFGALVEAADKGVKVRLIIDGLVNHFKKDLQYVLRGLSEHENIEVKLYEPLDMTRPWTWNNILHDKYIIVDNEYAIIGGRNIGDRYFFKDDNSFTKDRDVLIINNNPYNNHSVIKEIIDYYNEIWHHEFSIELLNQGWQRVKNTDEFLKGFRNRHIKVKENYDVYFNNTIDWVIHSTPTNNMTLIHNPIERFNSEPWIWYDISRLITNAKNSVFVQSPYFIPIKRMAMELDMQCVNGEIITLITNSIGTTPNVLAFSGYKNKRKELIDLGFNIYEYQGFESIHGKSLIIDERISLVGTFNIDARSTFLSTESMIVIDSEAFAKELGEAKDRIINKSLLVEEDYSYENAMVKEKSAPVFKRIVINLLRPLGSIFNYLL